MSGVWLARPPLSCWELLKLWTAMLVVFAPAMAESLWICQSATTPFLFRTQFPYLSGNKLTKFMASGAERIQPHLVR
ncbi:unnamed protein product [Acanthoscelides obtectus]|uniref:Secreted protein n=1 Tax=Acanthoscelides obtectus TaxID=200917 RepID=A0A9P0PYE8_ACAOB|nr:unnamed protein product [Acanthoscelides obtectus]CAK1665056.1 hypothetical protein AOBTE_LOCUS24636 [Acanthoscelides obtectus]